MDFQRRLQEVSDLNFTLLSAMLSAFSEESSSSEIIFSGCGDD